MVVLMRHSQLSIYIIACYLVHQNTNALARTPAEHFFHLKQLIRTFT
jgi:hypothetical protein